MGCLGLRSGQSTLDAWVRPFPSDHFATSTANTRIGGSPFAWDVCGLGLSKPSKGLTVAIDQWDPRSNLLPREANVPRNGSNAIV